MRTKTGNLATILALAISFGWGILLGYLVLHNTRPNAWYDMDFSIWMVCALYAFVHLFIGKLWCLGVTELITNLEKHSQLSILPYWTEDRQIIFGSLWPVSVPIAFLVFLFLRFARRKVDAGE